MERRGGVKNVLIAILLALIFPAVYLVAQAVTSFCATLGYVASGAALSDESFGTLTLVILLISGAITVAAALITLAVQKDRRTRTELRLRNPGLVTLVLAFILGVALNFASSFLVELIPFPQWMLDSYNESVGSSLLGGSPALTIFTVGIFVPIVEEIAFRSMPMSYLRRALSDTAAVIICSIIFALVHGNPLQMIYVLPVAVVLCCIFCWTESVETSIAAHIGYNGFSAVLSVAYADTQLDAAAEGVAAEITTAQLASLAVFFCAVCALLIWLIYRRRVEMVPVWNFSAEDSSDNNREE